MNAAAVLERFAAEARELEAFIARDGHDARGALRRIEMLCDAARVTQSIHALDLCLALKGVYRALLDGRIPLTANTAALLTLTARKLVAECGGAGAAPDGRTVGQYVTLCDKVSAGELIERLSVGGEEGSAEEVEELPEAEPLEADGVPDVPPVVMLSYDAVGQFLTLYEELSARTFKIQGELDDARPLSVRRQVQGDVQFLQNGIRDAHDRLLLLVKHDRAFLHNHETTSGFFVYAGAKKYFVSSQYIADVAYENFLEYAVIQSQRHFRQKSVDSEGNETVRYTPVYSFSSLFPHSAERMQDAVDTILIAQYMGQRVGMIVDKVERFATLVRKPLPLVLRQFSELEGIVFDSQYDMIPMLCVPELLKRFRSQRAYDIKAYESLAKKRVHKVLVVDDSDASRQVEVAILSNNGFSAESAPDGIAALELLRKKHFDLVVTDDAMPRMGGATLIDNMRRMEQYRDVPVIAMAVHPIDTADTFISKQGFVRNELIQKARELLHE